jgi:hypothetical protein
MRAGFYRYGSDLSRACLLQLPLLDVFRLETRRKRQRAHSLLSIAAHSYVWGQGLDNAQVSRKISWDSITSVGN